MKPKRTRETAARSNPAPPPPPARHRVLLVDDHPFMRAGLGQLIDRQPDLMVCGEASNPAEAMQALQAFALHCGQSAGARAALALDLPEASRALAEVVPG